MSMVVDNNIKTKILDNFSNYIIYSDGRVFSKHKNDFKVPFITKKGYAEVGLRTDEHKLKNFRLNRLIAIAFIKNENLEKIHVNHKDGNKLNNDVSNLEWCTPKENTKHAFENGLMNPPKADKQPNSKLKNSDIQKIIDLYNQGIKQYDLAEMFGLNQSNISRIINNKRWKSVERQ